MKFIPYSHQWLDEKDIQSVINVLKSDWLTQGPKVKEFEEKFAEVVGAKFAVAMSSGTAALHGAYSVADIGKGDEIITSPITFVSTANAALFLKAIPIFIDIEKETGNIDPRLIEAAITSRTKAIIPVHYGGHPAALIAIQAIAHYHHLLVIEDACHALGTKYFNEKIGSCQNSDITVFSFHPLKIITTGEGGMVTTNSEKYYRQLLLFRQHGIIKKKKKFKIKDDIGDWYHEMQFLAYNYRLTDFQSALGISQLQKLQVFVNRRRKIAKIYSEAFCKNHFFHLPREKSYAQSSWHLYPIRLKNHLVEKKREIFHELRNKNLGVQVHYIPIYRQPYYQKLGYAKGLCPIAEDFYEREISIPIYPKMTSKEIDYAISNILSVCQEYSE